VIVTVARQCSLFKEFGFKLLFSNGNELSYSNVTGLKAFARPCKLGSIWWCISFLLLHFSDSRNSVNSAAAIEDSVKHAVNYWCRKTRVIANTMLSLQSVTDNWRLRLVCCRRCVRTKQMLWVGLSWLPEVILYCVIANMYTRVSTTPGNPRNLLEFVWSSWKFLCKISMIDLIGFQSR